MDISDSYLENYLDIRKGDIFDKSKIDNISKNIENISFVQLMNPPD
ncbi:MAG: hypothetical protein R2771_12185 [Saprospiraceae bacterium]